MSGITIDNYSAWIVNYQDNKELGANAIHKDNHAVKHNDVALDNIKRLAETVQHAPARQTKLDQIKKELETGQYRIKLDLLAEQILAEELAVELYE